MLFSRLLPYGGLFAVAANAQSSSSGSSSSSNSDVTILSGVTEQATPTGNYISYSSTLTMTQSSSRSSSAISTEAVVSTVTSGGSTRTTTLGSTTIFAFASLMASNTSGTQTTSTNSQILLSGRPTSTTFLNGTSNSTTSTSSSAQATNTTPCNNYPEFCQRKYGNITEVSAHNSPFVKSGNAASNQQLSVTTQLDDGIRLVQGQIQWANNTPHFCHTSCDVLDAGPIQDWLSTVTSWVESHPYDVVTILLGNGNYSNVEKYLPWIEQSGIQNYAYVPPKIPMGIDDWPTLASMILTGKRVVIFMDYEANQTAVPWILDEFSQMWETPFDPTNRTFPCTVQRPPDLSDADARNRLYLVNHNLNYEITLLGNSLLVPNIPLLNVTNNNGTDFGELGLSAQQCNSTYDFAPKFLNVDYYNIGNGTVFDVAAKMNGVNYTRSCCGLVTSGSISRNEFVGRSFFLLGVCVVSVAWLLMM